MYQPTHDELIEMGFTIEEWEGKIHGYYFESLSYHIGPVIPYRENDTDKDKEYPYWVLGSWYHPWCPPNREAVETVIKNFIS